MNQFKNLLKRGLTCSLPTSRSLYKVQTYNCITYSMLQQRLVRDPRKLEEKYKDALDKSAQGDLKEIINMLWYTHERQFDSTGLFKASESRLKSSLNQLSEFDFSLLSYTVGQTGTGSVEFWYSVEREALLRLADGTLRRGNLGRLVIGLAESNLASDTFWERVQHTLANSIQDLNAEGVAYLVRGLAIAKDNGEHIDSELLKQLTEQFLKNFFDMNATEQLNSIIGWASLDSENDKLWVVLASKFSEISPSLSIPEFVSGLEALARVDRGTVKQWKLFENMALSYAENFNAYHLASAVWAFAKVDHESGVFWNEIIKHFMKLETSGCSTAKVLNALAGTKLVAPTVLKELYSKLNTKSLKPICLANWLLAAEKSDILPREYQKINKQVLEGYKNWTAKDKRNFLLATKDSKNVSADVIKALNEV